MVRKIQISFMFLALIVILVHTIIPHHHHKNIACLSSSDCHDEYYQHDHTKQEHHSKHSGTEKPEDCALQQMPAIPRSNFKYIITKYEDSGSFLQDIPIDVLRTDYVNILFFSIPHFDFSLKSEYTFLIKSSASLRAPPII
jgi:hypothetical protein